MKDAAGADAGASRDFPERAEAEAWMGDNWSSLLSGGAEVAALLEDGEVAYEMGLRSG
jgi:hypothetical protein